MPSVPKKDIIGFGFQFFSSLNRSPSNPDSSTSSGIKLSDAGQAGIYGCGTSSSREILLRPDTLKRKTLFGLLCRHSTLCTVGVGNSRELMGLQNDISDVGLD